MTPSLKAPERCLGDSVKLDTAQMECEPGCEMHTPLPLPPLIVFHLIIYSFSWQQRGRQVSP